MSTKTGIINDLRMLDHKSKRKHPECPARVKAIMKMLKDNNYLSHPRVEHIQSYDRFATNQQIGLVYPEKQIKYVQNLWPKASHRLDITVLDTYFNEHSQKIARMAVGGVLEGIDHIMDGRWKNGFSVVRPPGHHSGSRNTINGFCIFNNVAIGARYLQTKYKTKRIAIIDWDIHFGDGTHQVFNDDENVLFFSIHRYDYGSYYPSGEAGNYVNCGRGGAEGTKVNIPLNFVNKKRKEYAFQAPGDNEYIYIYDRIIGPILREFDPEFIIISSGFDAARYDYLGGFTVTPNAYYYMMRRVLELQKPTLAVLEGGYNFKSTAEASLALVKALLGEQQFPETVQSLKYQSLGGYCHLEQEYHEQIDSIIAHHSKWWKCLLSEEQIKYSERVKANKEKLFGVIQGAHETSSSSSQEPSSPQPSLKSKSENKKGKQQEKEKEKQQAVSVSSSALQVKRRGQQSTTQFYFAGGHIQRFRNFSVNNERVHKWAYPQQIGFYEQQFPEHAFTPKYFGRDGEYIVIQNLLFQQKEHVVMDIKLSRMSKYPHNSEDKVEKERKKEAMSTSQKYSFRIGGYTTPVYKEGGLLIPDEAVVKKLLGRVVTEDNRGLFCDFLKRMAEQLKEVKRRYFGTSIVLVRGKERSAIKWIDFHYWHVETCDVDLIEGVQNLCKFLSEVEPVLGV